MHVLVTHAVGHDLRQDAHALGGHAGRQFEVEAGALDGDHLWGVGATLPDQVDGLAPKLRMQFSQPRRAVTWETAPQMDGAPL